MKRLPLDFDDSPFPAPLAGRRRSSGRTAGIVAAAALAVTALLVRRNARQAERQTPPVGRFADVDGVRLHYLERGEGPAVVLLHGNGVTSQDFVASGVLDGLAGRYRVVAFDRPGFGYSDRPRGRSWSAAAQAELFRQAFGLLGIERPIVVGHSWGTLVALALALNHPEDLRGLVLLSGYYFPTVRPDIPLMAAPAVPVLGDVLRHTVSPLLGRLIGPRLVKKMFEPCPVPPEFHAHVPLGLMLRPSQIRASAADAGLMIPAVESLQYRYGDLRLPVTIVTGAEDKVVDPQQSERLHGEIRRSELRIIPGLGHMPHYSAPEQVVAAVDAAERPVRPPQRTA